MVDKDDRVNIAHYASNRLKRVELSVMAAEVYALFVRFEFTYEISHILEDTLSRTIDLEAYVDSRTLFNVIFKEGVSAEPRLQIDILALT